jgi:acyl carrier protein
VTQLLESSPEELLLVDLPNARVAKDWQAVTRLSQMTDAELSGAALAWLDSETVREPGIEPSKLLELDHYEAKLLWPKSGTAGCFDVYLRRRGSSRSPRDLALGDKAADLVGLLSRANTPAKAAAGISQEAHWKQVVSQRLPAYMVPSTFVTLPAMPLTPNGKLDRARLPKPTERKRAGGSYQEPANEMEKTLAAIWSEMLHVDRISSQDNFFDLGANSLMMVQAQGRIFGALQQKPSLVDLFRFPTVERLAQHLSGAADPAQLQATEQSQSRGNARLEALRRRRGARPAKSV